MDIRIFVEPQQGASYQQQLSVAQTAERLGFDGFFRSDHFLRMGEGSALPGPTDAFVTLGAIARETSRIRLGTLVASATFRHPGPLAIACAQIDDMSNGRLELGLGAGWFDQEHTSYAIPFPPLGERFNVLEEQLDVITGLWRTPVGSTFNYSGQHYQITDSPALPKPQQNDGPPIIIGGYGAKRTPRLAAKFANEFNVPFPPLEIYQSLCDNVRQACEKQNRNPDTMVYSVAQVVCCGENENELAQRAKAIGREVDELRQNGCAGQPNELVERLQNFAAAGASRVYLQVLDMNDLEHIELIAREVMPHL